MLKTSNTKSAKPRKGGVGVGNGSRARRDGSELDKRKTVDNKVDDEFDNKVEKKSQNPSKSENLSKSKKTELGFLTSGARMAFTKLRQVFIKSLIFHHFDLERHIWVETNVSGYAIGGIFSQLISDNSGRWHPVAFFSRKMIPAEIRYEIHNSELLAIVEAFKTWKYYLEWFQHEVLVLTNHNNLRWFMETKSLSSRQVCWAQKLSCYYFQIDYRQGKANGAVDALCQYSQQSTKEKKTLCTKNIKILHRLQSLLTKVSGLLVNSNQLSPLYQILICGTTVLPQL